MQPGSRPLDSVSQGNASANVMQARSLQNSVFVCLRQIGDDLGGSKPRSCHGCHGGVTNTLKRGWPTGDADVHDGCEGRELKQERKADLSWRTHPCNSSMKYLPVKTNCRADRTFPYSPRLNLSIAPFRHRPTLTGAVRYAKVRVYISDSLRVRVVALGVASDLPASSNSGRTRSSRCLNRNDWAHCMVRSERGMSSNMALQHERSEHGPTSSRAGAKPSSCARG